jgi:hypothetical protein
MFEVIEKEKTLRIEGFLVTRIGFKPMAYCLAYHYSFHYIRFTYFVVWTVSSPFLLELGAWRTVSAFRNINQNSRLSWNKLNDVQNAKI